MPRRPAARPRWAYDGTAGQLVEPPEGKRALGFSSQEEPPAQWVNYLLHWNGENIDWLAGPDLGVWTRKTFASVLPATFTSITGMAFDNVTDDTATLRFRYALVGADGSGPVMLVSKRGTTWEARDNFGASTPPGTLQGVRFAAGKWFCWFLGDSTDPSTLLSTAPNDGSTSAIGSDGTLWDAVYTTGASGRLYDLADDRAATAITTKLVAVSGISGGRAYPVVSTNGGTSWTLNTTTELSFGGAGNPHAIVYDGTKWVTLTEHGWVWTATDPTGAWSHTATLPDESSWTWRMETDGAGTIVAYQRERSTTVDIRVSTDHGATWTAITVPSSMLYIERIRFADGIWIATSSSAPYLWQSNDPTQDDNWTRIPLLADDGAAWAAYDIVLADGAWLAAGYTYTVRSGAARDVLAPVYGYDPAPGYLSDAGYLRGRRVDDTAPTDGQALVWSSASSRWVPGTASGGSTSPTTTAGDLIVRGASVDQRLAIGTSGQVLWVSAGAPAWHTLTAANVGAVPAPGSASTGDVLRWSGSAWASYALAASDVGAVPTARTITAGTGLTGGGDLSADRTLTVAYGTSSTTACVGNDARLSDARTPTAHKSSHATGGSDVLSPADIGAASFASGLDAARPAASAGLVGQVYYATNSGIDYRCISSSTWRVVGARGAVEGFDTTAVALSGVNATGNTTINAGVVASIVCTFAIPSSPSGVGIIASGGEWQLEIGNNSGDRYQLSLYRAGFGTARVTLGTVSGSPTTLHTVAVTFSGTTTRYSQDGGPVQTASHVSGSASGNAVLKFSSGGFPSAAQVTTLGLWSTGLSDADLVVASAAYATGRIPTVTGTLYSLWHAGWFTAAVLTQQMQVGVLGGALTWGNGFPLILK